MNEHGPLPAASVLALAAGLAEGLAGIHAVGVVHRDLKPMNVLLAPDGPRIIDFGISRAAEATSLTGAGFVVGSAGFMSPEQAEGSDVGTASDIFSLGTVLVFAATGEGPFGTGSSDALLYRVVHNPPDLERVPDDVRPLVERCLAKDPASRPTAADILAEVGAAHPVPGWLPDPVIRPYASDPVPRATGGTADIPAVDDPTMAAAPARGNVPEPGGDPTRPRRRRRRPLILAGLRGSSDIGTMVGVKEPGEGVLAPLAVPMSPGRWWRKRL